MSYAFDMPHGRELFQSRFLDRRCAAAPSVAVSPPDFDRSPRIEPGMARRLKSKAKNRRRADMDLRTACASEC